MKLNLPSCALLAALSGLFASCYPYPEPPVDPDPVIAEKPTKDEPGMEGEELPIPDRVTPPTGQTTSPRMDDPVSPPNPDSGKPTYKVAQKIEGRPGFVFSPFSNKPINVTGIPSGTLVQDPHYPASEKKYFRVP